MSVTVLWGICSRTGARFYITLPHANLRFPWVERRCACITAFQGRMQIRIEISPNFLPKCSQTSSQNLPKMVKNVIHDIVWKNFAIYEAKSSPKLSEGDPKDPTGRPMGTQRVPKVEFFVPKKPQMPPKVTRKTAPGRPRRPKGAKGQIPTILLVLLVIQNIGKHVPRGCREKRPAFDCRLWN